MDKLIKVARYRNYPFVVNYNMNDGMKRVYEWSGAKGDKVDIKEIPEEVVQYLIMNTVTFTDGELVIIEDSPEAKEIVENLGEEYKNNALTKEEIISLLKGNMNKMKSEFSKITDKLMLAYIVDVAKEIGLDSYSKRKFLADLINVDVDILFDEE